MVLPGTGNTISFNQIRIELDVPSQVGFNLRTAAQGNYNTLQNCDPPFPNDTIPDAINEWWNYDHDKVASFWANGKTGASCSEICDGTVSCDTTIYNFGSIYYESNRCSPGTAVNTSFIAPTSCFGGTFSGQTCYSFSNGTITSTETCTPCSANGIPCISSSECCSGCCDEYGYCTGDPCS